MSRKKAEALRRQAAEAAKEQAAARRRKSVYAHLSHGGEFVVTTSYNPLATKTGRISRRNAGTIYSFDECFRYKAAQMPHNNQLCLLRINGNNTGISLIIYEFEKEVVTFKFALFNRGYTVNLRYDEILLVGKGCDIVLEQEETEPLDLDEMNEMTSKIYKATNGGIRIFTDMYPDSRETIITGGKFRTYNGQRTPSAILSNKNGIWYMTDFGGESEPKNAVQAYMIKTGLGVDETLRKLYGLYVAKSEHEEQKGGAKC